MDEHPSNQPIPDADDLADVDQLYGPPPRPPRRSSQHPMNEEQVARAMGDDAHYERKGDTHRLWFGERPQVRAETAISSVEEQELNVVFVPPDEVEMSGGERNSTDRESKVLIPRSDYLRELLQHNNFPFIALKGQVTPEMMRKEPYRAFVLPSEGMVILVCNEEGNKTFLIYNPFVLGNRPVYGFRKSELEQLITRGHARGVIYPGDKDHWQSDILDAILYPPEITIDQADALVAALPKSADAATAASSLNEQGESSVLPPGVSENASPSPPRSPERKTDELIANGWKTVSELSVEHGPSTTWFRDRLDDFTGDDPTHKQSGIYRGKHAHFYSPPAVAHVLTELGNAIEFSPPPEHWVAVSEILANEAVSFTDVATDVRELRSAMPNEFAERKVGKNPPQWFASPEASDLLQERVRLRLLVKQDRQEHPDRPTWMLKKDIMREAQMRSDAVSLLQLQTFVDWLPPEQQLVLRLGDQIYYHRSLIELTRPFLGSGMRRQELEYYFDKVGLSRTGKITSSEDLQHYFASFIQYWETVKDWLHLGDLAAAVGVTPAAVSRKLPELRQRHGEWSSQGAEPVDTTFERISPDAVQYLRGLMGPQAGRKEPTFLRFFGFRKEDIQLATTAAPGWITVDSLARALGFRNPKSHSFAALLNEEKQTALNNGWVRIGVTDASESEIIVAPEFVSRLKEKRSPVPENWVAAYKVKAAHNITDAETDARLTRFRVKFAGAEPPLFGRHPGTRGEQMWYYDPYVLEWTGSREADTRARALPEWRTIEDAAAFTGVPISVFRKVIKEARDSKSDELKNFYPEGSPSPREYLSPALMKHTKENYRPPRKPRRSSG